MHFNNGRALKKIDPRCKPWFSGIFIPTYICALTKSDTAQSLTGQSSRKPWPSHLGVWFWRLSRRTARSSAGRDPHWGSRFFHWPCPGDSEMPPKCAKWKKHPVIFFWKKKHARNLPRSIFGCKYPRIIWPCPISNSNIYMWSYTRGYCLMCDHRDGCQTDVDQNASVSTKKWRHFEYIFE